MSYQLFTKEDYENLPEDDDQCFVQFESICHQNMNRMIDQDTSREFDETIRAQYMAVISAVGRECGIQGLEINHDGEYTHQSFNVFSLKVQGEVSRIIIRGRKSRPHSVQLTTTTKRKIEHHVSQLRMIVDASQLSNDSKSSLNAKLAEFLKELEKPRLSFGKTCAVLSAILFSLAGVTTVAAEGPAAVNNIMKLIGMDKASEDAATLRLAPPMPSLIAPGKVEEAKATESSQSIDLLDDDIPF